MKWERARSNGKSSRERISECYGVRWRKILKPRDSLVIVTRYTLIPARESILSRGGTFAAQQTGMFLRGLRQARFSSTFVSFRILRVALSPRLICRNVASKRTLAKFNVEDDRNSHSKSFWSVQGSLYFFFTQFLIHSNNILIVF